MAKVRVRIKSNDNYLTAADSDFEKQFRELYTRHGITKRGTSIALKNYRRDHGEEFNEAIAMKTINKLKKGKSYGQMTSYMKDKDTTLKGKDAVMITRNGKTRTMREEIADKMGNSKNPTERSFYELGIDKGLSPGECLRAFSEYTEVTSKWDQETALEFITKYT